MSVKEETQDLKVCRICLATDTKLHNIQETKLQDIFLRLMGTEECSGLGSVCGVCRAQLVHASSLRMRGRRAQALLAAALTHSHYVCLIIKSIEQSHQTLRRILDSKEFSFDRQLKVTIDYIRKIDRVAEKLCFNLKTCHVYNSDSTLPDIKVEDVKEETDDFTENIFVSEPAVDDFDDTNDYIDKTPELDMNNTEISHEFEIDDRIHKSVRNQKHARFNDTRKSKAKVKNKRKLSTIENNISASTKGTKRKAIDSVEKTKKKRTEAITKVNPTGKTKRVIKRRMADNGFLPDFNFEEFQNKYNVKIDILSKEEQLREIETRKMAPSYTLAAYGCEECGKGFATKQVYDAHLMKHDVSAGAHACSICGIRFRTLSRAHVHADAHRLRFTCACGFLTRTRFIAKNHFLSHAGTTHQCPHCDAVFSKYTSYLTHVRRRHPAMNVACDECGETFVGPNGLRHHKTRVHRNRVLPILSQHACATCNLHFASEDSLAAHSRSAPTEHDASLNPCTVCGASQGSPAALARHEGTCAAPRTRLCRECNKTFVDESSYDTHYQRIHLNIRMKEPPRARPRLARPFICELCGTECGSVSSLAAHQRSHAGARPHACPQPGCPLRFGSVHNMRRHHRVVHLGQRPQVACGVCGKLLAHAASLKLHVNTVHLKLPAPPRRRRQEDVK